MIRTTLNLYLRGKDSHKVMKIITVKVDMEQNDAHAFYIGRNIAVDSTSYRVTRVETTNIETV